MRTDTDKRSIVEKAMAKQRENNKVRSLPHVNDEEKELMDSRNSLIQDLDAVIRRYVRIRDADENGLVKCYCCTTKKHFTLMQCAHYISRKHIGLRFDHKRNLRTCCKHCNEDLDGNLEVYKLELNKEQKGLPEELEEQSRLVEKPTNDELKSLLIEMRAKLKIVESKLKNIKK